MSTLMCQVTCALCNIKIDELKWKEHQTSENHLKKCGENHNELTTKFFKMFFDIRPQREEIFNLTNEKTHDFWQSYFSPKLPKEKFDGLCNGSVDKVLLYEHCNSKEHKENEDYLIVMGMTYCDLCNKEIRNDEWRKHIFSENHMNRELKAYCKVCNMKYLKAIGKGCDSYYTTIRQSDIHSHRYEPCHPRPK